jgi:hypothetical protein
MCMTLSMTLGMTIGLRRTFRIPDLDRRVKYRNSEHNLFEL